MKKNKEDINISKENEEKIINNKMTKLANDTSNSDEGKSKKTKIIAICAASVVLVAGIALYFVLGGGTSSKIENKYIKIKQYKGLEIEPVKATKIDTKAINEKIKQEMAENKTSKEIKDRGAKVGDTVTVDYTGTIDGVEFEGGKATDAELEITKDGSEYIEGFIAGIKGHKTGEEFDVSVTFPENYQDASLSGKPANFHFVLKKIVKNKGHKLNNKYVKKYVKGCKTVQEYKAKVKEELIKENELNLKNEKRSSAMNVLLKKTIVKKYPQKDIDKIVNKYVDTYTKYSKNAGITLGEYVKNNFNMTEEQFKEQVTATAKNQVKQELIVDAIAKEEGLEVSESEYNKEMKKLAKQYKFKTVKEFLDSYKGTMTEKDFKDYFVSKKVSDIVVENVVTKKTTKNKKK